MTRKELFDHYALVVEEYRFQVELNWKRFQYFFVLTSALLVAGAGLAGAARPDASNVVGIHAAGALVAALALLAGRTQTAYYRSIRDTKRHVEEALQLGDLAPTPTPGQGSTATRRLKVGTALRVMMGALLALHVVAGAVAIA